jgi:excisionase family DNA binding protein
MTETAIRELLTVPEVAARLGQSRQTIYRKIAAGELPAVRLGLGPHACIRVPADELADFIYGSQENS